MAVEARRERYHDVGSDDKQSSPSVADAIGVPTIERVRDPLRWARELDVGEMMARNMGQRRLTLGLAATALFLAGCASRPSADALTESILEAADGDAAVTLNETQARCIADELLDSGLADSTVAGLAEDFDQPEVLASDADTVESTVADAAIVCADS